MSDADEERPPRPDEEHERKTERNRFGRLGESLSGLLDPESALRRGQGLVTGVTQATKEELMRIVSSEMRNFLDKMDVADLLQQAIAGLVVDVNMQIKFSREGHGPAQPEITKSETTIRNKTKEERDKDKERERDKEPGGSTGPKAR